MIEARIRKAFAPAADSAGFLLDVEIRAEPGITVLFGPSGSGKTLTLESIAGFVEPDQGRILLDDRILFDADARVNVAPRKRLCGYVFQTDSLFPHMTLRQNLEFAAASLPRLEGTRRVGEMMERFQLGELGGRRPHELSGGQRQRVAIARSLLRGPKALLLDEPAKGLDAPLRGDFYALLREVREGFRLPILLVTHSLEECFELAERMYVVAGGKVVQEGAPLEVYGNPRSQQVAAVLGDYQMISAEITFLDPQNKTSRLAVFGAEIPGPYFAGRFKGNRVTLCVHPKDVRLSPRSGDVDSPGRFRLTLQRALRLSRTVKLTFAEGVVAEMGAEDFIAMQHVRLWYGEIPPAAMRAL